MTRFIFLFFLSISILKANPLVVGSIFSIDSWQNQFEETQKITETTERVYFLSDMTASKILHAELEKKEKEYLSSKSAVVFSDIHKMPSIITRMIALPKMRSYSYPLLLITDEETGKIFPKETEKITFIKLKNMKIISIEFIGNQEEFQKSLETSSKK